MRAVQFVSMTKSRAVATPQQPEEPQVLPTDNEYFSGDTAAVLLPSTVTVVDIKVGEEYEGKMPHVSGNRHVVSSVPVGMCVGLKTGTIRWTPTPDQVGSFACVFMTGGVSRTITFNVVANPAFVMPSSATCGWISNRAAVKGVGTYNDPAPDFQTFRTSKSNNKCTKRVIYVRGGTYPLSAAHENPLGSSVASFPAADIFGTESEPVEIRPWGNERPKIRGNSAALLRFNQADYVTINGLEVQGESANVTYEEACADWWLGSARYNGNGFAIAGHHVTVKNCVVHEILTQAIAFKGATNAVCEDNIVANSARWTIAGTTAIGMVSMTSSSDPVTTQSNVVRRNLMYGVESRIYSRVFSKKSVHLSVDEGEQILFQPTNITGNGTAGYAGRYLAEHNVMMHGGKGIVINTSDNADVLNNTLYNMGSTMATGSAGLRGNKTSNSVIKNNLVNVINNPGRPDLALKEGVSFSDSSLVAVAPIFEENYIMEDGSPLDKRLAGNTYVPNAFADLTNNNPTPHANIPANIGADIAVFNTLFPKAQSFSVNVEPDPYYKTIDFNDMTKRIIDAMPSYLSADFSNWHDTLPYTDSNGVEHDEFEVPITGDLNRLESGLNSLKLVVVYPYVR